MTIAALHRLLDEIDHQGGPDAARHNRLHLEGPDPMTETPAPPATQAVPVGQLLKWGDDHPEQDVRDQAARARATLQGLRRRYDVDQELTAMAAERAELEERLAAIQARENELAPPKPKRRVAAHLAREVREWARQHDVDCPPTGRVPRAVVDAWRQATAA
ncbi:histone-like nucleoid-structuring protein Lsr2 [Streptomyces sp. NPDC060194]|uniref:Lsr2 family DNA-binding protein n=1 Tax=Streptomyces sp. NPDC060194 TaxID=3347069 RepID=UPI00366492FB